MYATIDLTDFNYRFTMKEDDSGFDVEEADDFEMIINGFVPYPELLDKECIDYAINIVDHAAEPMAGTIVTVRQLIQFVRTFIMQFDAN